MALPVEGLGSLAVTLYAEGKDLRGSGGAHAGFFFLNDLGRPIPGTDVGAWRFVWSGSFDWRRETAEVPIPTGARRAVFQIEKSDNLGRIRIDDVTITAAPNAEVAAWIPFHANRRYRWLAQGADVATDRCQLGARLLVPDLRRPPAGRGSSSRGRPSELGKGRQGRLPRRDLIAAHGFPRARQGRLQLADRLACSGINLVRLGDLDTPFGPGRSLFDDTRDDTKEFRSSALENAGPPDRRAQIKGNSRGPRAPEQPPVPRR